MPRSNFILTVHLISVSDAPPPHVVFVHGRQVERYFHHPTDASLARLADIMNRCRYLKVDADHLGIDVTMTLEPRDAWDALFGPVPALPGGAAQSDAPEE